MIRNSGLNLDQEFQETLIARQWNTPEKMLWAAVLEEAIKCWRGGGNAVDTRQSNRRTGKVLLAQKAHGWIFHGLHRGVSFEDCCAVLGVDADYIRMTLRHEMQANAGERLVRKQ